MSEFDGQNIRIADSINSSKIMDKKMTNQLSNHKYLDTEPVIVERKHSNLPNIYKSMDTKISSYKRTAFSQIEENGPTYV